MWRRRRLKGSFHAGLSLIGPAGPAERNDARDRICSDLKFIRVKSVVLPPRRHRLSIPSRNRPARGRKEFSAVGGQSRERRRKSRKAADRAVNRKSRKNLLRGCKIVVRN